MTTDEIVQALEGSDREARMRVIAEVTRSAGLADPKSQGWVGHLLAVVAGYGETESERRAARAALAVVASDQLVDAALFDGFRRRGISDRALAESMTPAEAAKAVDNWAWAAGLTQGADSEEDEDEWYDDDHAVYTDDETQMAAVAARHPAVIPNLVPILKGGRHARLKVGNVLALVFRERDEVVTHLLPVLEDRGTPAPVHGVVLSVLANRPEVCGVAVPVLLDMFVNPFLHLFLRTDSALQKLLGVLGREDDGVADRLIDRMEVDLAPTDWETKAVLREVATANPRARRRLAGLLPSTQAVLRATAAAALVGSQEHEAEVLMVLARDLSDPCPGVRLLAGGLGFDVFRSEAAVLTRTIDEVITNPGDRREFATAILGLAGTPEGLDRDWLLEAVGWLGADAAEVLPSLTALIDKAGTHESTVELARRAADRITSSARPAGPREKRG